MPDHYSVMLEIARDRATAASTVTCSSEDFESGRCPDAVSTGDRYLRRAVNEPCRKMVKVKFHYAILVAYRSEAGRRLAVGWNLAYHLASTS